MAWTTPKTWTAEPLLSSDMNAQLRDNMLYLLERNSAYVTYTQGSDYSTTSTTFVDVDGTNITMSLTPSSTRMLVIAQFLGDASATTYFALSANGTRSTNGNATDGLAAVNTVDQMFTIFGYWTGLTAGVSQTITLQYRVNSGTGFVRTLSGTAQITMWGICI